MLLREKSLNGYQVTTVLSNEQNYYRTQGSLIFGTPVLWGWSSETNEKQFQFSRESSNTKSNQDLGEFCLRSCFWFRYVPSSYFLTYDTPKKRSHYFQCTETLLAAPTHCWEGKDPVVCPEGSVHTLGGALYHNHQGNLWSSFKIKWRLAGKFTAGKFILGGGGHKVTQSLHSAPMFNLI